MIRLAISSAIERLVAFLPLLLSLSRRWKRALVVVCDAILCVLAVWLSFSLRLGVWYQFSFGMVIVAGVVLALWLPIFFWTGTYQAIFRYAGSGTIVNLAVSSIAMMLPMILAFMVIGIDGVPRTIAVLHPLIFFLLLALSRIVARYVLVDLLNQRTYEGAMRRILVYGAGRVGQQLASSMRLEPSMTLVAFVDDDIRLDGQRLDRVRVHHSLDLNDLIGELDVTDVFLALPGIGRSERRSIIDRLDGSPVRVRTLPAMRDLVDVQISVDALRAIEIEDLLGREPVSPDDALMSRTIFGKTVMVTGAGGSIGSELCRQIVRLKPTTLVLVDVSEFALFSINHELTEIAKRENLAVAIVPQLLNVADGNQISRAIEYSRPETLFHAAAYKHVPLVEANVSAGVRNNVFGTFHTSTAAERFNVTNFILVSTDKAVRPTNVMGATKRVCEQILQAIDARGSSTIFSIVRFGNVLGSSGSVVPLFKQQINDGGPITVTDYRITRFFMTIPEASQLVIQSAAMAEGGEVYLLDMGAAVRILDLARTMIKLSGMSIRDEVHARGDIEIVEVGLRPGEKLYEELLIGGEARPTSHDRIFRAHEDHIGYKDLLEALADLETCVESDDADAIIKILARLVPEYGVSVPAMQTEAAYPTDLPFPADDREFRT